MATKETKFINVRAVLIHAKKLIPNFDASRILFFEKGASGVDYLFTFVVTDKDGKPKAYTFYTHRSSFDIYVPTLIDYFDGKGWDSHVYYQPYRSIVGSPTHETEPVGVVIAFNSESHMHANMHKVRTKLAPQDVGFNQVARPQSFVTLAEFLS